MNVYCRWVGVGVGTKGMLSSCPDVFSTEPVYWTRKDTGSKSYFKRSFALVWQSAYSTDCGRTLWILQAWISKRKEKVELHFWENFASAGETVCRCGCSPLHGWTQHSAVLDGLHWSWMLGESISFWMTTLSGQYNRGEYETCIAQLFWIYYIYWERQLALHISIS